MLCFYKYDLGKSKSVTALLYVDLLNLSEKEWVPKRSEAKLYWHVKLTTALCAPLKSRGHKQNAFSLNRETIWGWRGNGQKWQFLHSVNYTGEVFKKFTENVYYEKWISNLSQKWTLLQTLFPRTIWSTLMLKSYDTFNYYKNAAFINSYFMNVSFKSLEHAHAC